MIRSMADSAQCPTFPGPTDFRYSRLHNYDFRYSRLHNYALTRADFRNLWLRKANPTLDYSHVGNIGNSFD